MTVQAAHDREPVVGPYSVLGAGAEVGDDCRFGSHVVVEAGAVVGHRVTVHNGVQVVAGVVLEDDVFVGPNATFVTDAFPRSSRAVSAEHHIVVHRGASIGANATVLPGVEIGHGAMIGAGAVVTRSVPRDAIVVGNPARIVGYVEASGRGSVQPRRFTSSAEPRARVLRTAVPGVTVHESPTIRDLRGSLVAAEVDRGLPFVPSRYFMVFDVPGAHVRGEHAHRRCHQLLICVHGEVHVVADDGRHREEIVLDHRCRAVHLPPMIWGIQYRYAPGSALLVLASDPYDPDDYIRDYDVFLREVEQSADAAR